MATSAQQDFIERRVFTRHLVNSHVKLMHTTIGEIYALTRDISDTGVFVEVNPLPKLPIGSHIKMHMLDSAAPQIAFNMKVVRTTAEGLGMMFIDYELNGVRYTLDALRGQVPKKNKKSKK